MNHLFLYTSQFIYLRAEAALDIFVISYSVTFSINEVQMCELSLPKFEVLNCMKESTLILDKRFIMGLFWDIWWNLEKLWAVTRGRRDTGL